jgi:hypothetical protein
MWEPCRTACYSILHTIQETVFDFDLGLSSKIGRLVNQEFPTIWWHDIGVVGGR